MISSFFTSVQVFTQAFLLLNSRTTYVSAALLQGSFSIAKGASGCMKDFTFDGQLTNTGTTCTVVYVVAKNARKEPVKINPGSIQFKINGVLQEEYWDDWVQNYRTIPFCSGTITATVCYTNEMEPVSIRFNYVPMIGVG